MQKTVELRVTKFDTFTRQEQTIDMYHPWHLKRWAHSPGFFTHVKYRLHGGMDIKEIG